MKFEVEHVSTVVPNVRDIYVACPSCNDKGYPEEIYLEPVIAWKVNTNVDVYIEEGFASPIGSSGCGFSDNYAIYDRSTDSWIIPDTRGGTGLNELLEYYRREYDKTKNL